MKTTVIFHSADFDGLFCREIARKFLPDAELIGWDFGDAPLDPVKLGRIYVLDLPVDRVFGFKYEPGDAVGKGPQHPHGLVWIDHHKSSIETHPVEIKGYRIDGVAACRLAWQWFHQECHDYPLNAGREGQNQLPTKQDFIDRTVSEPYAVRLAGEYDIWDKRDALAETLQSGLRGRPLDPHIWQGLLDDSIEPTLQIQHSQIMAMQLIESGRGIEYFQRSQNESIIKSIGFDLDWEGLHFLACNHARYNSHLFTAGLKPEHDACFGFKYSKGQWEVSLYHAPGKEHHDLSKIAVKYGGGGHRGACGFRTDKLPFMP